MGAPTHHERVFYLFGSPIAHSLSPLVHNAVFKALGLPWKYVLYPTIVKEEILPAMREADCLGETTTYILSPRANPDQNTQVRQ